MVGQLEQAKIRLELDEMEELLQQRRDERVEQAVAEKQFQIQVETARSERELRRQEKALDAWASQLAIRTRLLRTQTEQFRQKLRGLKTA